MDFAYFLAHASPDKAWVERLNRALKDRGVVTFYDKADVPWGEDWDLFLPRAQRRSWATVVCVSERYDEAHYLRDEVHRALAMARRDPARHRVLPLFMDGIPQHPPYGLAIKNGRDARALSIDQLADELAAMAAAAGWKDIVPTPPSGGTPSAPALPSTRQIHAGLCTLAALPTFFEDIVRAVEPPLAHLRTEPLAARARDLLAWAELQGDRDAPDSVVRQIVAELRAVAPRALP